MKEAVLRQPLSIFISFGNAAEPYSSFDRGEE